MPHPTILYIDIDDTLLTFAPGYRGPHDTGSLAATLRAAAMERNGWSQEAAEAAIHATVQRIAWWSWSDFLEPLHLNGTDFWEFAYRYEQRYLIPAEPGLADELARLKHTGQRLCITSNNPQDGIRHKLRLAGIPASLFDACYGATRMRAMKRTRHFWLQVLAASGIGAANAAATVGDSFEDDCRIPAEAGIGCAFLLNRDGKNTGNIFPGMKLIDSFKEIC